MTHRLSRSLVLITALATLALALPAQAQCVPTAGSCQDYVAANPANSALTINQGYTSDNIAGFAICADDFFAASSGDITSICFAGRYNLTPGQSAATEAFQITYFLSVSGAPDALQPFGSFLVNQAAGTLTRGAALPGLDTTGSKGPGFTWTATHAAVPVVAGTRYWVEIKCTSTIDPNQRWRWMINNASATGQAPDGDGASIARNPANTYGKVVNSVGDLCFCVNVGSTASTVPLAANATCAAAQTIAVPSPASPALIDFDASLARGSIEAVPFCKSSPVSGPTLWYRVTGTGTTLTASTCAAQTNFDTVIGVYCGSCAGGVGGLNCVASNDVGGQGCSGASGSDPSQVSWVATAGVDYQIAVFGYENAHGNFRLTLSNSGVASGAQPPCVSDRCPLDLSAVPGANFESEACGSSTTDFCYGSGVRNFALNQTYAGTVSDADEDYWELSPLLPSGTWFEVSLRSDTSVLYGTAHVGSCLAAGPGANALGVNNFAAARYCDAPSGPQFRAQTESDGRIRIHLMVANSRGLPCGPDNQYTFSVSLPAVGACCRPSTTCQIMPTETCNAVLGSTWISGATCAPDPCLGVCCRGTTCVAAGTTLASDTLCEGSLAAFPGLTAGAKYVPIGLCGPSASSPCCHADYNKTGGINVTDIFAFLTDWFVASPFTKVGGNGTGTPTVSDIFSFLTAWFTGAC